MGLFRHLTFVFAPSNDCLIRVPLNDDGMALTDLCPSLGRRILVFRANQTRLSSQRLILLAATSQGSHAQAVRVEKILSMPTELEIGSCTEVDNWGMPFESDV